ncbi:DoxX family protein [Schinkia azotoformans]|uniref:DoxX family protein n=1 Tax=Schinkia azotoformans LMG 9581 TaxID=1131731 RepID=K6BVP5_SCHAZ|nr:DoxX family protein [Schinkia azotoformans]EKN62980.1 DoxX family protein [Schinkia azotoformans LMG 9581]MEC1639272.1 DoxX family protein [Schinkia azotoformans]MEC1719500.1 DoxX family protein [Schinkia azotoformans]MEC1945859.1 DoxX family protein [Schinkia azotoformans]MED4351210.1 DoxX family protein [Schinkia azotoformans]
MINKWLRESNISAGILTIIRLYWGYAFFTAGLGKLTGGFDASGFLKGAIANPVATHGEVVYGWYNSFLEGVALPNIGLFNVLVPWGETLVGLGLMLGCLTTAAAFFGMLMNFSFLLAGTVSHNPTDILMGVIIAAAGYNAGKFGLDRFVLPFLRKMFNKEGHKAEKHTAPHSA